MVPKLKTYCLCLILFVALGGVLVAPKTGWAGAYANSAHGQKVTRTATANAGFPVGSCAHCHEQHASVEGAEHTPNNNLMFTGLTGDAFCNSCHDGSETVKDIATNWNSGGFGHGVNGAGMVCADCHDPHFSNPVHNEAVDGNKVQDLSGTYGSIVGTAGVEPTWPPVVDPTPGTATSEAILAPIGFAQKDPIEKEYQLCFKCHSDTVNNPYNPKTASDMNNSTGDLTLVAAQFNPNQYSHHPVTGTANWRNPNVVAGLKAPWNANPNARMYCTDCHGDPVSGAAGAHASNAKYMLKASGAPSNPSAPDCYDNLCLLCHDAGYDGGGGTHISPWSHGSNAAHQYEGESSGDNRLGCLACHGGPPGYAIIECAPGNGGKMGAMHGENYYWGTKYALGKGKDPVCGTLPADVVARSNPADHFLMGGYLTAVELNEYHGGSENSGSCWAGMAGASDGCSTMGGQGW